MEIHNEKRDRILPEDRIKFATDTLLNLRPGHYGFDREGLVIPIGMDPNNIANLLEELVRHERVLANFEEFRQDPNLFAADFRSSEENALVVLAQERIDKINNELEEIGFLKAA